MNGKPLAKALEHGMETMKINAKKSKPGVKIWGDLELERVWRQGDQQGMNVRYVCLKKYRVEKAVLGDPERIQVHSLCQEHSQEKESNV